VVSYLGGNRQLLVADLFVLKTFVQGELWSQYVKLTTADAPLRWDGLPYVDSQAPNGIFSIGKLKRGNIDSKIGLDVQSLDLEWYLASTDVFGTFNGQTITQLQAFQLGLWDNGRVAIYRAVMPTFGDCNTLGAMCMFAGRIAEVEMTRTGVKLKINALTEVFDQQLPVNVIEPTNTQAKYSPGGPPIQILGVKPNPWYASTVYAASAVILDSNRNVQIGSGGTSGSTAPAWATNFGGTTIDGTVTWTNWGAFPVPAIYTVQSGSTTTEVIGVCANGGPFPPDTFQSGYIMFCDYGSGQCTLAQIARGVRWDDGNGTFHLLEPLPWAPEAGCIFIALVPYTRSDNPSQKVYETVPVDTSGPGYDAIAVPGSFVSDLGVTYASSGTPLTQVDLATLEAASAGGIYAVDAGIYWFWTGGSAHPGAGGDAGKSVYISYRSQAPDGAPYLGFPYVPQASSGA
jgi:hypothetical protein